jgi:CRISPR system Cascade subunit CasE
MFFSRVMLDQNKLTPAMLQKWQQTRSYASHQWLWQLFPEQQERRFLFRHEPTPSGACFYLLSDIAPQIDHNMFNVETKPFQPQLVEGMTLAFSLRANPVITRQGKRSDVMMDAKFQARQKGLEPTEYAIQQVMAAKAWLSAQSDKHGFFINDRDIEVVSHQQQRCQRKEGERPICFTSVDFSGLLRVTNTELFLTLLRKGIGKSKGLGCGLMLIRRG